MLFRCFLCVTPLRKLSSPCGQSGYFIWCCLLFFNIKNRCVNCQFFFGAWKKGKNWAPVLKKVFTYEYSYLYVAAFNTPLGAKNFCSSKLVCTFISPSREIWDASLASRKRTRTSTRRMRRFWWCLRRGGEVDALPLRRLPRLPQAPLRVGVSRVGDAAIRQKRSGLWSCLPRGRRGEKDAARNKP